MHPVFESLPLVAAFLAVPQFVPQLSRIRRAGTTAGVSWSWAALTSVNNAAWLGYFALSGFWTALVPAVSATVLSGQLAVVLARRGSGVPKPSAALASAWAAVLLGAAAAFGRAGLGTALAIAFLLQVTPSVWTVYRSDDTTGVSRGTWLLIFGGTGNGYAIKRLVPVELARAVPSDCGPSHHCAARRHLEGGDATAVQRDKPVAMSDTKGAPPSCARVAIACSVRRLRRRALSRK